MTIKQKLMLVTVLGVGASCSSQESGTKEAVVEELRFDRADRFWFTYRLLDDPPSGTGLVFIKAKSCSAEHLFDRPDLRIATNKAQAGEYAIGVTPGFGLQAWEYFDEKSTGRVRVRGRVNPYSDSTGALNFRDGRIEVSPGFKIEFDEENPPDPHDVIQVEFEGAVVPDMFRPSECRMDSEKKGSFWRVDCDCINGRGERKKCTLESSSSASEEGDDADRKCCSQLNPDTMESVVLRGSFVARFCPAFCSARDRELRLKWCPIEEAEGRVQ